MPGAAAEPMHVGYPSSIAALGDSDSTGFDSRTPGRDAPDNVWATGTNPDVKSLYLRILAANPRIKGHAYGYAKDGGQMSDLTRQARLAVLDHVEYVTIEIGGNDVCSGGVPTPLPAFRARLASALHILAAGLPNARILVTSFPWANSTFDTALGPVLVSHHPYTPDGSTCDPAFDAAGVPNPQRESAIQSLLGTYVGTLRDGCAQFIHCRYDGGALAARPFEPADFSYLKPDDPFAYTHPSVQGLARLAEAAWKAGFDFADATAPVSKASRSGAVVTLTASDNAGVAGVEYRLAAKGAWIRYSRPVRIPKGKTLAWRAVDANGNSEATHSLHA